MGIVLCSSASIVQLGGAFHPSRHDTSRCCWVSQQKIVGLFLKHQWQSFGFVVRKFITEVNAAYLV